MNALRVFTFIIQVFSLVQNAFQKTFTNAKLYGKNIAILVISLAVCYAVNAEQPISSPQGTATTYVSEKGPIVYAPRAARAQKVIFDTPEKQLIYAPDTPFRRFFDSHAPDFEASSLEYAKTTILGDILAQLQSKEYIRALVREVVAKYQDVAISDASYKEEFDQAKMKLDKNRSELEKALDLVGPVNDLKLLSSEVAGTLGEFSEIVDRYPDRNKSGEIKSALKKARDAATAFQNNPYAFNLQVPLNALKEVNQVASENAPPEDKPSDSQQKRWRETRAEQLQEMIYLELLNNNYPDLEDAEIDSLFKDDITKNDIWNHAVTGPKVSSGDIHAMELHLVHKFKQRDWLKHVIDQAVAKRLNLFKKAGSPVDNLRDAESAFGRFVDNSLFSEALSAAARENSLTLWQAFLKHANSNPTNSSGRFLLQPKRVTTRQMPPDDLRVFGSNLRQVLLQPNERTGQPKKLDELKETLTDFLAKYESGQMLCPEFGINKTSDALLETLHSRLTNGIQKVPVFAKSYGEMTNKLAGANVDAADAAVTNFLAVSATVLVEVNNGIDPDDQAAGWFLSQIVSRFKEVLPSGKAGIAVPPTLATIVSAGVAIKPDDASPLNTSRALRRFVQDFVTVFGDDLELMRSDDPILVGFLASNSLKFATPEFRKKTIALVPGRFYKDGSLSNTVSFKNTFKIAVEDPEIAFYFGGGVSNPQVVDAFKQEFYSAFHDSQKLREAIKAEVEADYDYWWLTFYPKALPLGHRKLAGDSIIEIAFPETVIPQSQYHRWLQDSALKGAERYASQSKVMTKDGKGIGIREVEEKNVPGDLPKMLELRNATALLRDTLNVLEASELTEDFAEVRLGLIRAFDAFTEANKSEETRYWNGIKQLHLAVYPDDLAEYGKSAPSALRENSTSQKFEFYVSRKLRDFSFKFYEKRTAAPSELGALEEELSVDLASLREDLSKLQFGSKHILFSVIAVTHTKARLPEKINLFAWAASQGTLLLKDSKTTLKNSRRYLRDYAVHVYNTTKPLRNDEIDSVDEFDDMLHEGMTATGDLYKLIVNAYFSRYPDVPTKASIRRAYFDDGNERLRALTYEWLDHYGVLFHRPRSDSLHTLLAQESFLTPRSARQLANIIEEHFKEGARNQNDFKEYRASISNAVNEIFTKPENFSLVSEINENLFDDYFASIWEMLSMVEETERHAIPYALIKPDDFRIFRSWARPVFQRGIQIVEMLPASRDDLVSISINEGGVVAKLAAQADAAAAYDLNNVKMAQRYASLAGNKIEQLLEQRRLNTTNLISGAQDQFDESGSSQRRQVFRDMAEFGRNTTSQGYSVGATASANTYARVRAAMAYSKRREYLDAAITAAGRGDNMAKWIVRKSDFRSSLAKQGGKKLAAAAHHGYPNGDQPFQMLVKIPHAALKTDWEGRKYIYFNSTYVATKRTSTWKMAGFVGLILKTPLALINPRWWSEIEEGLVGTQFPFMWDVKFESDQLDLLREPNFLGGEIWLDQTDKIKHSEILEMTNAEDVFIRATREAQSGDLGIVMKEIEKESGEFGSQMRTRLKERLENFDEGFSKNETAVSNRVEKLENELEALKERLNTEQKK